MTLRGMRVMLIVTGCFVLLAGFQLFVLTERTDKFFAWTIATPLTAAFLGAGYWGAAFLEFGAARRTRWVEARTAMPTVLVFTTITLVITFVHLDKFHTSALSGVAWIAVYVAFPPAMAWVLWRQVRAADEDPPRIRRLPPWLRGALALQAAILLPLGVALLAVPVRAAAIWPWPLTPLTGRAIGAWVFGIGILAVHMALENDIERVAVPMTSYVAFAVLELIALVRYTDTPGLSTAGAIAFAVFLAGMLVIGAYGALAAGQADRAK